MSYNVLADSLAEKRGEVWHMHTKNNMLAWTFRFPRIVKEIEESGAGVICM